MLLERVLFLPNFQYNLISASKLAPYNSIIVKFGGHGCLIHDLKNVVLGKGWVEENLYIFCGGDV